jgi:hypothetical protein
LRVGRDFEPGRSRGAFRLAWRLITQTMLILASVASAYQQVTLQKNTLDVFDNPNTDALLARLNPADSPAFDPNPEFVVYGVATEYFVRLAVDGLLRRGRCGSIVTDGVLTQPPEGTTDPRESLESCGARPITSEEALKLVGISPTGRKS